ncbi:MAG: acyl carrier protein [Burkholderiaceae bacterium]|nr:acyl carrier protein [Burkholderiaceae bacterium]
MAPATDPMQRDLLTREQAEQWLAEFLHAYFGVPRERIRREADLYADLDLDSIDAADIVLQFNQTFGRKLDVRSFRGVRTLGDVLDALFALEKQLDA